MRKSVLATLSVLCLVQSIYTTSNVVCYHATWSQNRPGNGNYTVDDVPAELCTHYMYAFVGLNDTFNELMLIDPHLDIDLGAINSALNLKKKNPNLKILLSGGGWGDGSGKYSKMVSTAANRATFITSVLTVVATFGYDGYDLGWKYPTTRSNTHSTIDKDNFSSLLKEFNEAFRPFGLLLTAGVSAKPSSIDISYDVPVLSRYLDLISVMTYDFHNHLDHFVGHVSPLYSSSKLGSKYADYSINASINGWIERGADPSKLCLGVPFYGRNNILANASNTTPGSAAQAKGSFPGPYTNESGFWGYNEIIEIFAAEKWTKVWDKEQQVPYAYSNTTWLSYDNPKSITLKVEFAKNHGLGGIMLWSLDTDDFHGLSGTKNPLLKAINITLNRNITTSSKLLPTPPLRQTQLLPATA